MNYELWLAALCIWREARGCPKTVKEGVWHVMLNRTTDEQRRWPRTIAGVILQHEQFSSFNAGDPNAIRFPIPPVPPDNTVSQDWNSFTEAQSLVAAPPGDDPTLGANCYESLPVDAPKPKWATPEAMTAHLGTIRFYKI